MSIKYECPHGKHEKHGAREYFKCDVTDTMCHFTRWCTTSHAVVFTKECEKCKARLL